MSFLFTIYNYNLRSLTDFKENNCMKNKCCNVSVFKEQILYMEESTLYKILALIINTSYKQVTNTVILKTKALIINTSYNQVTNTVILNKSMKMEARMYLVKCHFKKNKY